MPTDVASWGPYSGPPSAIRRYSSQVPRARLGSSGAEWGVAQRTFLLRRASFFSIESTPAMRQSWVNSARARPFLGGVALSGFVATLPSPYLSFDIPAFGGAFSLCGAVRSSDVPSPSGLRSARRGIDHESDACRSARRGIEGDRGRVCSEF